MRRSGRTAEPMTRSQVAVGDGRLVQETDDETEA